MDSRSSFNLFQQNIDVETDVGIESISQDFNQQPEIISSQYKS